MRAGRAAILDSESGFRVGFPSRVSESGFGFDSAQDGQWAVGQLRDSARGQDILVIHSPSPAWSPAQVPGRESLWAVAMASMHGQDAALGPGMRRDFHQVWLPGLGKDTLLYHMQSSSWEALAHSIGH